MVTGKSGHELSHKADHKALLIAYQLSVYFLQFQLSFFELHPGIG